MKNTNRALLSSIVALILCCSMLVGSTFAWFTDSVTSGTNIIAAGNLDVELYHQDKNGSGKVDTNTTLFDDVEKWEPGAVAYENLTVSNEGNLALKYKLTMIVADENKVAGANGKGLSEALKVAVVKGGVDTTLTREELIASITTWETLNEWNAENSLLKETSETFGIVIYWEPTTNDNEWNVNNDKTTTDGKDLWIDLGVNLVATQLNHEVDSFDKDYDKDATYTDVPTTPMTGVAVDVYDFLGTGNQTDTMTLDFTCYTFDAAEFQSEYPVELYKNWICDYYVSTDKALNDGLILAGQYDSFSSDWIGFYAPKSTEAYEPTPLLGTVTENMNAWNYQTICESVKIFKCGLVDTKGLNGGTNVTVELCMLNPENHEDRRTVCSITVTLPAKQVSTSEEIVDAINSGVTQIALAEGEYTLPTSLENVSLIANGDVTVNVAADNTVALGNNVSLKGITFANSRTNKNGVVKATGENINIEGCTFDLVGNSVGVAVNGNGTSVVVKDCTFTDGYKGIGPVNGSNYSVTIDGCTFEDENGVYGIHLNAVAGDIIVKNSTVGLFNTFFGFEDESKNTGVLRFENCDFVCVEGKTNVVKLYRDAEFVDCDFEDGFLFSAYYENQNADWTFANCTYGEGSVKDHFLTDSFSCNVTATFDNEIWVWDATEETWTQQ